MYRFMYCTTLNPLGDVRSYDYDDIHDVIACCINFRNKQSEKLSAGYSVYTVDENDGLGETLLNWQHDGKNIFGHLTDPNNPSWFFVA